jgi:hypothetical protein
VLTTADHLDLIERDRIALLAKLEAELDIDYTPARLADTFPIVPLWAFLIDDERSAEIARRVARAERRAEYHRDYVAYCRRRAAQRAGAVDR